MKAKILIVALLLMQLFANAQQVPRAVLAEHFTNTYCSICAARNPGLFTNMTAFPQVIHLAYYPSAPYAACPLSMHNPSEADARTNYYGVYGGTPQLVVGGSVVSGSFTNPNIFSSQLAATSSFALTTSIARMGSDSVAVTVVVKKVATSSLTSLQLYAAIVEDTLSFAAANGETANYDVFRKALWGATSLPVTAPMSVGDSSTYQKTVAINAAWNLSRIYTISVLQQADKEVVQASRSAHLQIPASLNGVVKTGAMKLYPNPAGDKLFVDGLVAGARVRITDSKGADMGHNSIINGSVDVSGLKPGLYFLFTNDGQCTQSATFIKR